MNSKIIKIIKLFFSGKLQGMIYEKLFVYLLPELTGQMWLLFYKVLYRNIRVGKKVKCWGRIIISKSPDSNIVIGDNVHIVSDHVRASIALYSKCKLQAFFKSKIIIGNNVGLNGTAITCRTTSVEIGAGTIIASNCIIIDSDFHVPWPPDNRTYNLGYERDRRVKIGNNVWIGLNCTILKGVTIGENSIIGAGSVVVNDIPPHVLARGNPAKVIKKLPQSDKSGDE